jgi:hypothetical protein
MKAIYTKVNGKKIFIGKHIGDSIVREFSFASATLWQNKSLSFDKKLLKYAEDKGVESFIFSDPKKRTQLKIGIESVITNGADGQHGQGNQWYIPKEHMEEMDEYRRTAYVTDEVVI